MSAFYDSLELSFIPIAITRGCWYYGCTVSDSIFACTSMCACRPARSSCLEARCRSSASSSTRSPHTAPTPVSSSEILQVSYCKFGQDHDRLILIDINNTTARLESPSERWLFLSFNLALLKRGTYMFLLISVSAAIKIIIQSTICVFQEKWKVQFIDNWSKSTLHSCSLAVFSCWDR